MLYGRWAGVCRIRAHVLDIPYQLEVLCILAIGHKAGEAAPRPTETLKWEKIHIGRYQMAEEPTEEA